MNGKQSSPHNAPPIAKGHSARLMSASNTSGSEIAEGNPSIVERQESTPNAFAPSNPTPGESDEPQWLANCLSRLISATCETLITRAHSTPTSLPSTIVERTTPMSTPTEVNTSDLPKMESTEQRPTNRDINPPVTSRPQGTNTMYVRGSVIHNISADHSPGGPEMSTKNEIATIQHKVLPPARHSDRQPLKLPTAWLYAHPSSSPDEDMPKRVADSERYQPNDPPGNNPLTPSPDTVENPPTNTSNTEPPRDHNRDHNTCHCDPTKLFLLTNKVEHGARRCTAMPPTHCPRGNSGVARPPTREASHNSSRQIQNYS